MPWIEQRGDKYRMVWREDGKKHSRTFATLQHAEDALASKERHGFPTTAAFAIDRLQQSMGTKRRKLSPKLSAYAYDVVEFDPNIGETTRDAYRRTIRNHVEGSAVDVPLDQVDAPTIRKFYAGLAPLKEYQAAGNGMKSSVYRVVNKVLAQAVRDGVIDSSPMSRASIKRPSKRRATEVEPLTIDEVEQLAAATLNERDRLMILVGGYCGLRGGEVGGLRAKDVDPKACTFHVRQAVKGSGANKSIGLPKGDKARRITVPCSIAREVAKFAKRNAASDGRIFHTEGLVGARQTNKVSQAAAKRAGMRPVHFHMLRHTTASLLVASGASVKDVQAYLGISTAAILLDTYSHAFEGTDQRLADSLEARRADWQQRVKQTEV